MQKIWIDSEKTTKEIVKKYKVSRSTAWRARKRGYLCLDYHKKEIVIDNKNIQSKFFTSGEVYKLAWKLVWNLYSDFQDKEDLVQEAVLRLLELSGHHGFSSPKWRYTVAKMAMMTYMKNYHNKNKKMEVKCS